MIFVRSAADECIDVVGGPKLVTPWSGAGARPPPVHHPGSPASWPIVYGWPSGP